MQAIKHAAICAALVAAITTAADGQYSYLFGGPLYPRSYVYPQQYYNDLYGGFYPNRFYNAPLQPPIGSYLPNQPLPPLPYTVPPTAVVPQPYPYQPPLYTPPLYHRRYSLYPPTVVRPPSYRYWGPFYYRRPYRLGSRYDDDRPLRSWHRVAPVGEEAAEE